MHDQPADEEVRLRVLTKRVNDPFKGWPRAERNRQQRSSPLDLSAAVGSGAKSGHAAKL
jgi:hypothetical protein